MVVVVVGPGAGVALLRRRCSREGGEGGWGPVETWREEGRDGGREEGVGSGGGAGPRRVRDGRREREDAAEVVAAGRGFLVIVGDTGWGAVLTGEGAGAARGIVVVVVAGGLTGTGGGAVLRFLRTGLLGESTISECNCAWS